jgi:hypothetical protein
MTRDSRIKELIYTAFMRYGAMSDMLGIIGSWGDTMPDEEIEKMLEDWLQCPDEPSRCEYTDDEINERLAYFGLSLKKE